VTEAIELALEIDTAQTATDALSAASELSADTLESCFSNGAVWLQRRGKPRRCRKPAQNLHPGDRLFLNCNESTLAPCPYQPTLIADHGRFSLWYKPAGMLSQGSKWGDHWALYHWIEQNYWPERHSLITHRLDRFTSGIMLVAHDEETNRQLHRQFAEHKVEKTYRALVWGIINQSTPTEVEQPIDDKPARTSIKVLATDSEGEQTLIQASPATGRKHQIRIHLASLGHPIVNDRRYGREPFTGDLRLQACSLTFQHPHQEQRIAESVPNSVLLDLEQSGKLDRSNNNGGE
jgi:tRNA pseudouridine32 synthase/23S rRNA pseudouridine746 synthase